MDPPIDLQQNPPALAKVSHICWAPLTLENLRLHNSLWEVDDDEEPGPSDSYVSPEAVDR